MEINTDIQVILETDSKKVRLHSQMNMLTFREQLACGSEI